MKANETSSEEYRFGSLDYVLTRYPTLEGFVYADDSLQQTFGIKAANLKPTNKTANEVLRGVNECRVAISYLSDDFSFFREAYIVESDNVHSGTDAQDLIEHCLNTYGGFRDSQIYRPHKFAEIEFIINEVIGKKRIIHLITKAEHPEISWREMFSIIVAERKQPSFLQRIKKRFWISNNILSRLVNDSVISKGTLVEIMGGADHA